MIFFALHTLGCKVNQCDGDALAARLEEAGYVRVAFDGKEAAADIYIINTCTVTHTVDKKSMQYIRRARRMNVDAFVAVCGCMVNHKNTAAVEGSDVNNIAVIERADDNNNIAIESADNSTAAIEGADFVFDTRAPEGLLEKLAERFAPRGDVTAGVPQGKFYSQGTAHENSSHKPIYENDSHKPVHENTYSQEAARTRAFLKVQDGCDRFCTYCIVPYVRGTMSSMPIEEAVYHIGCLVAGGYKEIVLTGIQLAAYGKNDNSQCLPALIRAVVTVPGLSRLRLSSLEPQAVTQNFLDAVSNPVVCGHFHLSLQSGCDVTLARMNRRYSTADYTKTAAALRALHPAAALTTDVIVGFPGETEEDFQQSVGFVKQMGFARVHVFPYSPRTGTKAADMPRQVAAATKKARTHTLLAIAAELRHAFLAAQVDRTHEVLFETPTTGYTRNYCPVHISRAVSPNTLAHVYITGSDEEVLKGEQI